MPEIISGFFGRAKNDTVMSDSTDVAVAPGPGDTTVIEAEQAPAEDGTESTETIDETVTDNDAEDRADADDDTDDQADEEEDAPPVDAVDEDADESDADEEIDEDATDEDVESADEEGEPVAIEADAPPVTAEDDEDDEDDAARPVADEKRPAAGVRGSTTVDDAVVAKVVTIVAGKIDGVHSIDDGGLSVEVADDVATIKVSFVVEYGHPIKALAEQLRVEVIEAVEQLLGLDVATVDVHISDIHQ